ncbi:potassium/proton antiporter [Thalassoglobus sp. JC818]|uniref:potassium/proton antiporter n=1 Tax=Thalassoglobus sp. JC818 TaxID=3232136 RepID=UPI00345B1C70
MFLVDRLILVCGVLLLLGIASNKLSSRWGIPGLVLFLLLGMLAGSEGIGGIEFENYELAHGIGTIALVMILFDGGLSTRFSAVRLAWKSSMVLATVGVFVTAAITGLATSWILEISLMEGMLLGGIVSSTDAAAVFSILRSGGVSLRKHLVSILELESGSNDPMAIFLTVGCIEVLSHKMPLGIELLGLFASQMLIGAAFGLGMGRLATIIVNRIELDTAGLYPILVSTLCLLTFGVTAQCGGSGFLAVYLTGLILGNSRLVFQRGIRLFHDASAWLSQIVMFVMLGLLSFPSRLFEVGLKGLLIGCVLMLIARPVAVVLSLAPFRFPWKEQLFISWVGLKGAVPIVLATFPLMLGTPRASLMFDIVFFIVVLSAVVQGSTLRLAAQWLGLTTTPDPVPPVTLEISSLRNVEGDIVDYLVSEDSRAAGRMVKDLALPEGVVIATLVRNEQLIPPQGKTLLLPNDHAIVVLRPERRAIVNHIFAPRDAIVEIPAAFEFPIRPTTTLRNLNDFYGITLDGPLDITLEEVLKKELGIDHVLPGNVVQLGPLSFRIRSIDRTGGIEAVGMTIHTDQQVNS